MRNPRPHCYHPRTTIIDDKKYCVDCGVEIEDTVMDNDQIMQIRRDLGGIYQREFDLAEISFKAGYDQRKAEELPYYREERLVGIKEVVNFMKEHHCGGFMSPDGHSLKSFYINAKEWQAKLKEWGIE